MTLEAMLKVLRDTVNYIDAHGMFVGGSVDFSKLESDLGFAAAVETSLKSHGVEIPGQVDKIIKALPFIETFI